MQKGYSKYPRQSRGLADFEPLKAAEDATCVASSIARSRAARTANWLFWQPRNSKLNPVCPPGPYSRPNCRPRFDCRARPEAPFAQLECHGAGEHRRKCQTTTVTPAKPGDYPIYLCSNKYSLRW